MRRRPRPAKPSPAESTRRIGLVDSIRRRLPKRWRRYVLAAAAATGLSAGGCSLLDVFVPGGTQAVRVASDLAGRLTGGTADRIESEAAYITCGEGHAWTLHHTASYVVMRCGTGNVIVEGE